MIAGASAAVADDGMMSPSALLAGWQFEGALGVGTSTDRAGNATGDVADTGYGTWRGALRGGIPFGGVFAIQGDLQASGDFLDSAAYYQYRSGIFGGLHLNWRNPSHGLLGVFGGVGAESPATDSTASLWFGGVEGQLYLSNATLYLQGGFLDSDDSAKTDAFHDAAFIRGVGRYFLSSSTVISGEVLAAAGKQDTNGSYSMDVVTWGVKLEHALASHPMVLTAAYEGGHYDNGCCAGDRGRFTDHRFLIGAKVMFGEGDLFTNDRFGQTVDLPDFARIVASGNSVD
jgi:hypothetical protein